jgi:hypothetical protein
MGYCGDPEGALCGSRVSFSFPSLLWRKNDAAMAAWYTEQIEEGEYAETKSDPAEG